MKIKKKNHETTVDLSVIAEFIIEEFRFMRMYSSAVNKLFLEEKKRFVSAFTYHENKIIELMEKFGLRAIKFDGLDYDEGMPITPLNPDEFDITKDRLIVEQTYDPTILTLDGRIIKQGTVSLALKVVDKKETTVNDGEEPISNNDEVTKEKK